MKWKRGEIIYGKSDRADKMDSKEHPEEWENTTITDYLGQMASWVDDCSAFDDTVDWEKVDYKTFAEILYMGKIYE